MTVLVTTTGHAPLHAHRRTVHPHVQAWLLLLPALVLLIAFTHWPIVASLWDSVHSTPRGMRPKAFVGLDNYAFMIDDPVFWQVMWNNLLFALGTIPASIALALLMAVFVNERLPARGAVRLAYFTPTVLPMVAVASIWLFFFTPQLGLLDQVRAAFGAAPHNWLGDPSTVLWCIVVMTVWKEAGFFMIFYLAALQAIPPNLTEAAAVEGASRWYTFRRVVLPLLMPTTLFVLINATINSFKLVDQLFILTKGGPDNASSLLLYYIYETAFAFNDWAYAATLTAVLIGLLGGLALIQFVLIERRVHYR